ncbi:MAG: flagellar biosynthetic protein FliR [Desulfovibrio sp.]|nr:flagellar biosynthetic protein FliR [Desulfovibrio sp.]
MNIFATEPMLLFSFLLTLLRISIVMFMLPVFNTNNIPIQVKAAVCIVLSLGLWPALSLPSAQISLHPLGLILMICGEVFMGLILSLAINLTFMAIQSGGELLGYQMGFTMLNFADPLSGNQTGTAAFFLWTVSLMVFLCLDGHLYMLRGFAHSFALVPPGSLLISQTLYDQVMQLSSQLFILAIQICAPVMVALFAIEVALGLVARTSPQIHIMDFGMPLKIFVGFFFLGSLLVIISEHITNFAGSVEDLMINLLRSLSPFWQ